MPYPLDLSDAMKHAMSLNWRYARSFATVAGTDTIAPHTSAVIEAPARIQPMVLDFVAFHYDWKPPPLRWYWKNRLTRWSLRKFGRHPPWPYPPLTFGLWIRGILVASFPACVLDSDRRFVTGSVYLREADEIKVVISNSGPTAIKILCTLFGVIGVTR